MVRCRMLVALVLSLLVVPAVAGARTRALLVVTNTSDSGAGSLRQAIIDSNTSIGTLDTIQFNIGSGVQTISLASPLPTIVDPVIIDGTSQPGFVSTPLIEIDGTSAGASANGLTVSSGSTIRSLVINRFQGVGVKFVGPSSSLKGCFVGTDPTGTIARGNGTGVQIFNCDTCVIGGTAAADANLISGNTGVGISISTSVGFTGHLVQGNRIGTDLSGTAALANFGGILASSSSVTIGGTVPGAGNIISGNTSYGILLSNSGSFLIQSNRIGTNASGTAALANGAVGIQVTTSNDIQIGGDAATAGNLISGNGDAGIDVAGLRCKVQGNRIGTDVTGSTAIPNASSGIRVESGSATIGGFTANLGNLISGNTLSGVDVFALTAIDMNRIGTDASGLLALANGGSGVFISADDADVGQNTIAFNGSDGIRVFGGARNRIFQNSIYSNGGLGIELGSSGILPNDALDSDLGPNNQQNYPILASAVLAGGQTVVTGSLNSTPNTSFTIEYFSSPGANPSGFGDGKTFLVSSFMTSDPTGLCTLNDILPSMPLGTIITATATDSRSGTSSFSPAVPVVDDATAPTVSITGPGTGTFAVKASPLALNGIASDNVGVTSVVWSSDRGPAGAASYSMGTWTASVTLLSGTNVITVTAFDAVGNFASDVVTVILDTTAPTVAITIPTTAATYSSASTPLSIWGTASDDLALASVAWSNSAGGSGTALGTTLWAAAVPLTAGSNVITFTATDTAGNTATAVLTVDFALPSGTTTVIDQTVTKKSCGALGLEALAVLLLAGLRRSRRR